MKHRFIKEEEFQSYYEQLHSPNAILSLHSYLKLGADEIANLSLRYFSNIDLQKADLSGADLSMGNFRCVDFRNANLRGAILQNSDLRDADLSGADLRGVNFKEVNLSGVVFRGANLEETNLQHLNFGGADFRGANLRGANLISANLISANLVNANLQNANLYDVTLTNANISGANLSGVNLNGVGLIRAVLIGAKGLTEEQLIHARKQGAITKPEELLPALKGNELSRVIAYDVAKILIQMAENADATTRIRYTQTASEVINYIQSLPFEQQPENCQYDQIKENVLVPRIEKGLFKERLPRNVVSLLVNKYLAKEDITHAASVSKTDVMPLLSANQYQNISQCVGVQNDTKTIKATGYKAVRQSFAERVRQPSAEGSNVVVYESFVDLVRDQQAQIIDNQQGEEDLEPTRKKMKVGGASLY